DIGVNPSLLFGVGGIYGMVLDHALNVGIGVSPPTQKLDVAGAIKSNTLTDGQMLQSVGGVISNATNTNIQVAAAVTTINALNIKTGFTKDSDSSSTYWFPLCKVSIPAQYQYAGATFLLAKNGSGVATDAYGCSNIFLRVKQQNAMSGTLDYLQLIATNSSGVLDSSKVKFVLTTDSSSLKEGTLYVQNTLAYSSIEYTAIDISGYLTVSDSNVNGVSSLPSGTQYNCTSIFHNTTDGKITIPSLLSAASGDYRAVTSDSVGLQTVSEYNKKIVFTLADGASRAIYTRSAGTKGLVADLKVCYQYSTGFAHVSTVESKIDCGAQVLTLIRDAGASIVLIDSGAAIRVYYSSGVLYIKNSLGGGATVSLTVYLRGEEYNVS
ncbi:MAG TPA: hypothetical protein VIJ25_09460, partial [Methylococcales bacterium]